MTKRGRDRRKQLRADRRTHKHKVTQAQKTVDMLMSPIPVDVSQLTPDLVLQIADISTLSPSEQAFNEKMQAMGVPSFGEFLDKNLQRILDREAMNGKVGAFLWQQMLSPPKDVSDDNHTPD